MVNFMNLCLLRCLHVLGTRITFINKQKLPVNTSVILISNHQSMFDIPLISWYLRKLKPKFISKIELGSGIPSISFNLRNGENVLIDRKNPKQSIPALSKFGKFIKEKRYAAVIFPEGTRSRDGLVKNFAPTGLKILFKTMPEVIIIPLAIHNSWKLLKFGNFPMGLGVHLKLEVLSPEVYGADSKKLEDFIAGTRERMINAIEA